MEIEKRGKLQEGYFADVIVVDTKKEWIVGIDDTIESKCGWTPYENWRLKGKNIMTIVNGEIVYENGKINENVKSGKSKLERNKEMANLTLEEKVAKALFDVKAVKINVGEPFTFASGIKSPIYCDNRYVLGFSDERDTIVESFVERIDKDVDVIVGVATAGIPWASFIADRMKKPLAYVRNKPKDQGAGKQIEGAEVKGKKVVVIEDLITTGKSSLIAVDVLQKEEVKELEVKSIFSYGFDSAKENYAKYNCKFSSLSNFDVLIKLLAQTDYLTQDEAKIALEWSKAPEKWGR